MEESPFLLDSFDDRRREKILRLGLRILPVPLAWSSPLLKIAMSSLCERFRNCAPSEFNLVIPSIDALRLFANE